MVATRVPRVGMNENAQPMMVQHQPGHERGKQAGLEGDLEHRLGMRPDWFVMPLAEADVEAIGNLGPKRLGLGATMRRIEIDMRVVAGDFGQISRHAHSFDRRGSEDQVDDMPDPVLDVMHALLEVIRHRHRRGDDHGRDEDEESAHQIRISR